MPNRHRGSSHRYPRTARLNELLRQIVADELERLADDRLELVTVTGVSCAPDLRQATVYLDTPEGPESDDVVLEALGELRHRLQAAVARQARVKRTPELSFVPDPAIREATRIEEVLRGIHQNEPGDG
ncbi:ribosome-binding factor A [soil metagenome]